jgi:hypothetical protein
MENKHAITSNFNALLNEIPVGIKKQNEPLQRIVNFFSCFCYNHNYVFDLLMV